MPKNFVSNKDETVRMFENNLLESLSRVHPSVPVIIFLPVIVYFFREGLIEIREYEKILILFLSGLAAWTLIEYLLHRFLFHYDAKSEIGKKIHFIFHGVHHDYPSDSKRLVMPPSVSIPLATIFYYVFIYLIGPKYNSSYFAGFLTGYLLYDMTHYAIHHFNMKSSFWLAIKNNHIRHHYQDSSKGFGVSTPLWDIIIGTGYQREKKKAEATERFNE